MNKEINKKQLVSTIILVVLVLVVALGFMASKKGMFLDEIYSYGLSNSHYAPFMNALDDDGLVGATLISDDFNDYLTVQEGERFDVGSVLYNQKQDVHPPLYYLLLNAVSSLMPNEFSMWTGLLLGLPIWLLTGILLYRLTNNLIGRWDYSLLAVGLWMLSQAGLSTLLMIRMYVLLTFMSILLAYLLERIISGRRNMMMFLAVGAVVFAGCLTQYFFAFYAFFACLVCGISLLGQKCIKQSFALAACSIMGVILFLIVWPAVFTHLGGDGITPGVGVLSSIMTSMSNLFHYPYRVVHSFLLALKGMPIATIILGCSLFVLLIGAIHRRHKKDICEDTPQEGISDLSNKVQVNQRLIVIIPAVLTWVAVVVAAPFESVRYVYNLMPFIALAAVCVLQSVLRQIEASQFWSSFVSKINSDDKSSRVNLLGGGIVILCTLCLTIIVQPDYLYHEFADYDNAIAKYIDDPCIYYTDNKNPAITSDILQLRQFTSVYVSNAINEVDIGLASYLSEYKDFDHLIVYVDVYQGLSGSGYDSNYIVSMLADRIDASNAAFLYKGDFSEAWLISGDDA